MKIIVQRDKFQPSPDCMLGLVMAPEVSLTLCTMELPWIPSPNPADKGGLKNKSCLPLGKYKLERHVSKKKYPSHTFALVNHDLDVLHYEGDDRDPDTDRATALLHAANRARELQACIAFGLEHKQDAEGWYVTSSRKAMDAFFASVPWVDGHTLSIVESL